MPGAPPPGDLTLRETGLSSSRSGNPAGPIRGSFGELYAVAPHVA